VAEKYLHDAELQLVESGDESVAGAQVCKPRPEPGILMLKAGSEIKPLNPKPLNPKP
jgi:hypothetical protein